jgi:formamidopyrimidine-DNA glycosylase
MNDAFDEKHAKKKLKQIPDTLVCDALLDQKIFAGVGNIIKMKCCSEFRFILHQPLVHFQQNN